jgi:Ca2+/Na+ antiporter
MKLRTFLIVNTVVAVIVGIILVIIPRTVVRWFGLPAETTMDIDNQLYGSELILMGLVCWIARNITEVKYQRGITAAFTIANLISLVLAVIAQVNHTFNTLGWIAIIAYLILTVVYGYYYFTLPAEAAETRRMEQHSEATH